MRFYPSVLAAFCLLLTLGAQATPPERVEAVVVVAAPAGGTSLNGILRLPTGPGPFPAAVLLPEHQAGTLAPNPADKQLLSSLADYLVGQGMVVLRLEERGSGTGPTTPGTLAERSADALAALNYLRTRPQVDVTRLGLIGHGEGGNVALLASAQGPQLAQGLDMLLGSAWDAELEPYREAGDGAAVTWLHQVV